MPKLQQLIENPDLLPLVVSVLISGVVFILVLLVTRGTRARGAVRRRAAPERGATANSIDATWQARVNATLERAAIAFSHGTTGGGSSLRRDLIQAGFFSQHAPGLFGVLRVVVALALPAAFLIGQTLLPFTLQVVLTATGAIFCALIGMILPTFLLDARIRRMRQSYSHAFPDMMDLLLVCVESGQSVQSGFAQVSREIMQVSRQLGYNLHLLSLELRAGSSVNDALYSLHGRIALDEVKSLAVLLKQSEELGASISGTLRVFSEEMRDKRLFRAETKANMLPVKMTIPLGLFIFPVILMVILVPVAIRIKNAFV